MTCSTSPDSACRNSPAEEHHNRLGASLLAKNDNAVNLIKNKMPDTQEPLKQAAYDAWFKAQVQAGLDNLRPSIPDEEAKRLMAIKREKLRRR